MEIHINYCFLIFIYDPSKCILLEQLKHWQHIQKCLLVYVFSKGDVRQEKENARLQDFLSLERKQPNFDKEGLQQLEKP